MAIIMMATRIGGSIIPPCSLSIDFTEYLPVFLYPFGGAFKIDW
jgi:hypothetical protein